MKAGKKQLLYLVTVMASVSLTIAGTAGLLLYRAALEHDKQRLLQATHIIAHDLKASARMGVTFENGVQLSETEGDQESEGQIKTWEVVIGKKEAEQIRLIYVHGHQQKQTPRTIPLGPWGEPLQRALSGATGTMVGLDYAGTKVLAAYTYVPELQLGIVTKTDLAEVQAPFLRAGAITLFSCMVLVLLGSLLTQRFAAPLLRQLEASEQRFRSLAESSPIGIFEIDANGERGYANPHLRRIVSLPVPVFEFKTIVNLIHPDDRPTVLTEWELARAEGRPWFSEHRILTADGEKWVRVQTAPVLLKGSVTGFVGIVEDISQQRKLLSHRSMLARIVDQNHESVVITDVDGTILYVNAAFERATGYTRAEALGQNPRILKSGQHDPEFYERMWSVLKAGDEWTGRLINRRKDGGMLVEDAILMPIRDSGGRTINYVAIKRDVSVEHNLEEQLRQAHKMEAIGRLAGGIAHDFNNLLGVIIGYTELILGRMDEQNPLYAKMSEIKQAADRAASLTRQLLAFGRRQVLKAEPLNLNVIVAEIESLLARLLGEDIQLELKTDPQLGQIAADKVQIEQVLMNLAANARDAMPNGGTLRVESKNVVLDDAYVSSHPSAKPGPYVMLSVTDTGIGMDPATLARLFEPFFTTKELGKGTGLGLATVYGIVKQSGGWIWVYSEVSRGSTFKIYLPRTDKVIKGVAPEVASGRVAGTETILLVEDSEPFRRFVSEGLRNNGYVVLEAESADEAIKLTSKNLHSVNLLLTDMVMPGSGGRDLAERLTAKHAGLRVVYMSGFTRDLPVLDGVEGAVTAFIQKPFVLSDLLRLIRAQLDR